MRYVVTGKRSEIELSYASQGKQGGEFTTRVKLHVRHRLVTISEHLHELCADSIAKLVKARVLVPHQEVSE